MQASRLDAAAFGDLYHLYFPEVLAYMRCRVSRYQEAEDLANTVFERAFAAMSHYEPSPARFPAWLYTIARNLVIDHYRRRRIPLLGAAEDDDRRANVPPADPAEFLLAEERRRVLYRAILDLTDEQRVVIGCRYFYNLPIREVAEFVGKTEGAVKALQFRALESLRRRLTTELGPP